MRKGQINLQPKVGPKIYRNTNNNTCEIHLARYEKCTFERQRNFSQNIYICFENLKKNRKKTAREIRGEIGKSVLDSFVDLLREKSYGSSKE